MSTEAAPGVELVDVSAVNAAHQRSLYAKRPRIHPQRASGQFRKLKWILMAITLGIYYVAPWLRWDRPGMAPDQAILIDMPNRKFYFFFIEIWPQEVYFLTGLLILAALTLFLVTSVAGRVWCGYFCPQTVWTDLFIAVERWIEGDRNARIRLDRQPWSYDKIRKKIVKHGLWIIIAVATGGAWVFYFRDAPTLATELVSFDAPLIAYLFVGLFTTTTYLLGGLAREQVCTYMCPWPRIQGAMFDSDSLLVTYRGYRGEPRGAHKKNETWDGRGDCVDCKKCVAVCPMGIDIRDGPQLECIQCALCVDACNSVMDRVQRPRDLIAYDTFRNIDAAKSGGKATLRVVRPRTILYAALIVVVGILMIIGLSTRSTLDLTVLRDRNPLFVQLSDGNIRNNYTLKIINKLHERRTLHVIATGLPDATVSILGQNEPGILLGADSLRSIRIFVAGPKPKDTSVPLTISLVDETGAEVAATESSFRGPGP